MNLESLSREFQQRFDRKMAARERALIAARRAIRCSANAIRAIHRQDRDRAAELMEEARSSIQDGGEAVRDHPDVAFAGFLQDAQKEYVEARFTEAMVDGGAVPGPDDLGVQLAPYLNGMAEAASALGVPVVGGNVSLYNESRGRDIDPTPVVGMVGLIDDLERRPPGAVLVDGGRILLLGDAAVTSLAGSAWASTRGHVEGRLPAIDYDGHRALLELVRRLVADGVVAGIHDVADGGLGVALAEMAFAGDVGFRVTGVAGHAQLFSEAPSRVVVCALPDRAPEVMRRASEAGVPAALLGGSGGDRLVVEGLVDLALAEARDRWRSSLPEAVTP